MASRYDDFDVFMVDVIQAARQASDTLTKAYDLRSVDVVDVCQRIIRKGGFPAFVALIALLMVAGPLSLPAMLANPVVAVLFALFGVAALKVMWSLYRDRRIAAAIKELGERIDSRAPIT